ncbi:MAG TPA: hypothetical protein VGQ52_09945 [Gemmatimonadaceae bacterium]|nr:hypothetical protein [Gemmatimonadaceae bacterium]
MRRNNGLPRLGFAFFCLTVWARLAAGQPATIAHAACTANFGGTTYFSAAFSAPFEKDPRGAEPSYHTMVTWGAAFGDYVAEKYGGPKGGTAGQCALAASLEQAQAGVKARMRTAARLMQKVVETDWVYKSAVPPGAAAPSSQAPAASSVQTPPNANAQGTTMRAVCWSDLGAPGGVIYFSQVFDTRMERPDQSEDTFSPMANEFHQYLKGRYDYKADASRAAQCAGSQTQGQVSAQRS